MMTRRSQWLAMLAVLPIGAFVGCGGDGSTPSDTTTPTGIANPASVYCEKQGGTVELVDESDGQRGYCNLPDGTRIEEWEYYRSQTGVTTQP